MLISPMGANFFASHPPLEERIGVLRNLLPSMLDATRSRRASPITSRARSFGRRTAMPCVAFAGAASAGAPNAFRAQNSNLLQRAVTSEALPPDLLERMAARLPDLSFLGSKTQTQGIIAEIVAFNPPAWVFSHQILAPVIGINLFLLVAYTVTVGNSWVPAWMKPIRSGVSLAQYESARIPTTGANCFPSELSFDAPPLRFERPQYPEDNAETIPLGTTTRRDTRALDAPYSEVWAARSRLANWQERCAVNACSSETLRAYTQAFERYVDRRRALTEKLQQVYGSPALAFAHDFFETDRDREFIANFRRRTEIGQVERKAVLSEVNSRNAAAIDLLLSHPAADFVPCTENAARSSAATNAFGIFFPRDFSR